MKNRFFLITCFTLLPIALIFLVAAQTEVAHLPRIIETEQKVTIEDPEISQAFYGKLQGFSVQYEIHSSTGFLLYVNLLVPDLPGISTDIIAEVNKQDEGSEQELMVILDGREHDWEEFFEPFAGDSYLRGPEFETQASPGTYSIKISHPQNQGKYVLSIGKKEVFTFQETIHTIRVLPILKREFFEKSPLTAYFNIVGLFLSIPVLVLLAAGIGIGFAVRKKRKKTN